MKTSARNQFAGTVGVIDLGPVSAQVTIALGGGGEIVAAMTTASAKRLKLKKGKEVLALIKASSVLLATDLEGARLSARNQLPGTVSVLTPGAVNAEVTIDIDGGGSITAIVTQGSVKSLGLAVGSRATAFFKASSVILAVTA